MKIAKTSLYKDFIWRRIHSLAGLWLVIYITLHLWTNSQAALLIGDDGKGFIHAVNAIHELPYLPILEFVILVLPFLIHIIWGLQRLWTAKLNAFPSDGSSPSLPEYSANRAFTWQRITSWILIVGIAAHVIHMRFLEYPSHASKERQEYYMLPLSIDDGLYTVAERLDVDLYTATELAEQVKSADNMVSEKSSQEMGWEKLLEDQKNVQREKWVSALERHPLKPNEVMALAKDFGTADLLMLRNTFKSPLMIILYSILVITACFHAFNGLWTFLITWGGTLSENAQRLMKSVTLGLMFLVTFLGLIAVWGTYWINLKQ